MSQFIFTILLLLTQPVWAQDDEGAKPPPQQLFDRGRLLATGGVSQVEGAGGGGLSTWALITGYGSRDAIGANAHYTFVGTSDFHLNTGGVAVGLFDRVELSYARVAFNTRDAGAKLGLGRGFTFHENVYGAKLKLFGDAIFDQDRWWPQVSIGVQHKTNDRGAIIRAIGGKSDKGTDYYISASKMFLSPGLLVNATLRQTKANQFGILGFGGDKSNAYHTEFEGAVALLLSKRFAIGADYRTKPSNLSFAREQNAFDVFAAFFLNKHLSATVAYVGLGDIALQGRQNGVYISLQAGL